MSTVHRDALVDSYLTRLEAAAAPLPEPRRQELLAEIRSHLAEALGDAPADETTVRNVLERLGSPEEIVAAALDPDERPPGAPARRAGALEITGLVLIAIVPLLGWAVGAILVGLSDRWRTREKTGAFLVLGLGGICAVVLPALGIIAVSAGSLDQEPIVVEASDEVAPVGDDASLEEPVDGPGSGEGQTGIGPLETLLLFTFPVLLFALGPAVAAFLALRLRSRPG